MNELENVVQIILQVWGACMETDEQ